MSIVEISCIKLYFRSQLVFRVCWIIPGLCLQHMQRQGGVTEDACIQTTKFDWSQRVSVVEMNAAILAGTYCVSQNFFLEAIETNSVIFGQGAAWSHFKFRKFTLVVGSNLLVVRLVKRSIFCCVKERNDQNLNQGNDCGTGEKRFFILRISCEI